MKHTAAVLATLLAIIQTHPPLAGHDQLVSAGHDRPVMLPRSQPMLEPDDVHIHSPEHWPISPPGPVVVPTSGMRTSTATR